MASGEVRAFDAMTGGLRWTFHPLPENAPAGGANTWSRIEVDEAAGLVFLPTGSAAYDFYGGDRKGANLYANSIVALDAATGRLRWHRQLVHHDIWDYDLPAPPALVTIRRAQGAEHLVGSLDGRHIRPREPDLRGRDGAGPLPPR